MSSKKLKLRINFTFLTMLIFALFYSCASLYSSSEKQLFTYLTDNSKYYLLPTSGMEKPMDMAQYIFVTFRGHFFFMNAWVKADEESIEMTLFNEMGASIGELSFRDRAISISSNILPKSIKPEYIVADFQLCFYNPVLLSKALEKCSLTLIYNETERKILKGDSIIIEIEKSKESVKLTNNIRGYTYTLEGEFY